MASLEQQNQLWVSWPLLAAEHVGARFDKRLRRFWSGPSRGWIKVKESPVMRE
jgi:hypothetical protein